MADSEQWSKEKIRAVKRLVQKVGTAKRNSMHFVPTASLWSDAQLKPLFPKNAKSKDIKVTIQEVNKWLGEHYTDNCETKGWPAKASRVFKTTSTPTGLMLWFDSDWNAELEKQRVTVESVLFTEAKAADESKTPKWSFGPLSSEETKVGFEMDRACEEQLRTKIRFDPTYFPDCPFFLRHYLKMHLRHALTKNKKELYSRHIAWFGCEAQVNKPYAILFNPNLLSSHDRKVNLLLLCVPNKYEDPKKPWFAVRLVLSSELSLSHRMRDHLRRCEGLVDMMHDLPDRFFPLTDGEGRALVPSILQVPQKYMLFDPTACVHSGSFVEHMRQENRIPQGFRTLSDDELRSRADWAVERARDCPNIVLTQLFCDKRSEDFDPQLILPMTLDPPPALAPRLGLVLQARWTDKDIVCYTMLTALPLDVVFSNVLVCQPRGGHWLSASLPDVQMKIQETQERMAISSDDTESEAEDSA